MDLNKAIEKHMEWKMTFRTAIDKQSTLDSAAISKDNVCELGKWLYGEAKLQYRGKPEYQQCVAAHAAFHVEAGKVAAVINTKQFDQAKKMIGSGTPYTTTSSAARGAIFALQSVTKSTA